MNINKSKDTRSIIFTHSYDNCLSELESFKLVKGKSSWELRGLDEGNKVFAIIITRIPLVGKRKHEYQYRMEIQYTYNGKLYSDWYLSRYFSKILRDNKSIINSRLKQSFRKVKNYVSS